MKKILVVDDEREVCELYCKILSKEGYEPISAFNGREALDKFKSENPGGVDLVILDYHMQEMNGLEVLREIRKIDKDMPVIMISGSSDSEVKAEAKKLKIVDFLSKCISVREFLNLIKISLASLLIILGIGLGAVAHAAQQGSDFTTVIHGQAEEPTVPKGMEERITLDLKSIEVSDAMKYLAQKGGLNIVTTKNVTGRITLSVKNVPIKDVFDIILRSNGLAYDKHGEIYTIMTEDEYKVLYGEKFSDIRQVKTFRLKYAIPEQAFNLIDMLKSDIGKVLVDQNSGTVLIMDTPEKIALIEEALSTLEEKSSVRVFNIKYAQAKDIEEHLKPQIDAKKLGSVKADERSNQVVVRTLPERMGEVESLIQALDQKTREVLIDVKIIKVILTDKLDTGINWDKTFETLPIPLSHSKLKLTDLRLKKAKVTNNFPIDPTAIASTSGTLKLWSIGYGDEVVEILIKYLQRLGNTKVLSNPKLAVVNNQEAKIHIGTREAYITTTTTTGQTTSTIAEEVTFVDVGIKLSVTPTINTDGYVTMKIKPEVSSVIRELITPSNNKIPIVDTSTAETTVMVKDGANIVIGGLRKTEQVTNREQVPVLGDIPFIGVFFRKESKKDEQTELLLIITPHIVGGERLLMASEPSMMGEEGIKSYREYESYYAIAGD